MSRVRDARRSLAVVAIARAVAWGLATACGLLALVAFASLMTPSAAHDHGWPLAISVLAGAIVTVALLWRTRHVRSLERVALWIEERVPELEYALVTAVDQERSPNAASLESHVARYDLAPATRGAVRGAITPALAAVAIAIASLYASTMVASAEHDRAGGTRGTRRVGASVPGSRIAALVVQVTPPSYTGGQPSTFADPSAVQALVGSTISVSGEGDVAGLGVALGRRALRASPSDRGWTVMIEMPAEPTALTLRDRGRERILVLDPRADDPPHIELTSPRRDTTLRIARGVYQLAASATDDIGLSTGRFEYLVTSGSGERFSARTIAMPAMRFGGARGGTLQGNLDLGTLSLAQGDVLSIRAVVQDANRATGPGLATSDTRTIRIARADEYDSVSVDAAAPLQSDSSAMSQRMLVMMTEALVRAQRTLTREQLVRRSTEIAELEDRVRIRVHELIYPHEPQADADTAPGALLEERVRAEAEGTPGSANLAQAYNALWESVRSLRIAEPAAALPSMRRALEALDRARVANRLYLRGTPPRIIVDLARVRLTGRDKGGGSSRAPRSRADSVRARLELRFGQALALLPDSAAQAMHALALLQADALASAPSFGVALGDAIDAFRHGRDATNSLLRARRALSGEPMSIPGLSLWSGVQ